MRAVLSKVFGEGPYDAQRFDPHAQHAYYGGGPSSPVPPLRREDDFPPSEEEEEEGEDDFFGAVGEEGEADGDDDDDAEDSPLAPADLPVAQEEPSSLGCWILPQDVVNRGGADRQNRYNRYPMAAGAQLAALPAGVGGGTVASYDSEAFRTPFEVAQEVVCTGALINTYTGEVSQTYEDALPPPNREGDDVERQNKAAALRLHRAQGGEPRKLRKRELQDPMPDADAGVGHGDASWRLNRDVHLESEERKVREGFFTRNDEIPSEMEMTRNPYGFRGFQNLLRPMPHMPLTQELDNREWMPNAAELPTAARTEQGHVRLRADAPDGRPGLASGNVPEPHVRVAPRAAQGLRHLQQSLEPARGLAAQQCFVVARASEVRASLGNDGTAISTRLPLASGLDGGAAASAPAAATTRRAAMEAPLSERARGGGEVYGSAAPWQAQSAASVAAHRSAAPELPGSQRQAPSAVPLGARASVEASDRSARDELVEGRRAPLEGPRAGQEAGRPSGLLSLAQGGLLTLAAPGAATSELLGPSVPASVVLRASREVHVGGRGARAQHASEAQRVPAALSMVAEVAPSRDQLRAATSAHGSHAVPASQHLGAAAAGEASSRRTAPLGGDMEALGAASAAGCSASRLAEQRASAHRTAPLGGDAEALGAASAVGCSASRLAEQQTPSGFMRPAAASAWRDAPAAPGPGGASRLSAESPTQGRVGSIGSAAEAAHGRQGAQQLGAGGDLQQLPVVGASYASGGAHRAPQGEVTIGDNRGHAPRRLPVGRVGQDAQLHVPRHQGACDGRIADRARLPARSWAGGTHLDSGRAMGAPASSGAAQDRLRRRRTPKPARVTVRAHPGPSGLARFCDPVASRST